VKESSETVLFLHLSRNYAASALWTSKRMDRNNQDNTRCKSRKKANGGVPHPIASSDPKTQNRKTSEMHPSRQFGKCSDRVIPPFLVRFLFICRLGLELENDPFHTAMQMTPNNLVLGINSYDVHIERQTRN